MVEELSEISCMLGGPQGTGVDVAANIFAKATAMAGYFVYGKREYHSNIKGEHSYFQVIVSTKPVNSYIDGVHILITFDAETLHLHTNEIFKNGALFVDAEYKGDIDRDDILVIRLPYVQIIRDVTQKYDEKDISKLMIVKNVIGLASALGLLGTNFEPLEKTLQSMFLGKKGKLVQLNIDCARMGFELGKKYQNDYKFKLSKASNEYIGKRVLLNGATSIGLAKVACGCTFQAYYPITPATDESLYLEERYENGIIPFQTEDEIAAILAAAGAAVAGARSSTSTSGPGFSLMAEGLGWAGINEIPLVVVNYQRGGPSTGLPTRTDQSDLKFAINAGHGEFPRIVLSPGDIEEAFYTTFDAFNYAERYQLPVIMLCDKVIANTIQTVPIFDTKNIKIDRGNIATEKEFEMYQDNEERAFKRFLISEALISPRAFPGQQNTIHWLTGDEHDEIGHVTEEPNLRSRMHAKRMNKLRLIDKEIPKEKKFSVFGYNDASNLILAWGTTKGAIVDAIEPLRQKGIKIKFVQIKMLCPFPKNEILEILKDSLKVILIENNFTSQLGSLLQEFTGRKPDHYLLKWTGRPISRTEIIEGVEKVLRDNILCLELKSGL